MKKTTIFLLCLLLFTGLISAQNLPSYLPSNGLVGWWPFNGNANDESGNGNNGIIYGASPASDRFGNPSSAFRFNGVDNFIKVNNSSSLQFNGGLSISTWVRANALPVGMFASTSYILSKGNDGGFPFSWCFFWDTESLGCNVYESNSFDNCGPRLYASQFPYQLNQWYNVVVVFNGTTAEMFVNGQLVISRSCLVTEFSNQYDLLFGRKMADPAYIFNGDLDDISIYDRALNQQEITGIFEGGSVSANCLPSYVPTNGLLAYYPFCGNANDQSGNNLSSTSSGISFISDRSGNPNSAVSFAGNGSVKTPFSQQISPANFPNYSISLWFRRTFHNGGGHLIFQYKEGSLAPAGTSNFDFHESNSGFCGSNKPLIGHYPFPEFGCSPTIPSLGSWHHATLLFSQTTDSVQLYLNGNYWFSSAVNNDFPGQGHLIFGNNASDEFAFTGDLDDIAIYNRALSQQEITALYQGGNVSTSCPVLPANLLQGLKGYWPFCGNANDESGNGNNGSVFGATLTADRFGNPNSAFSFNGTSRIETPTSSETLNIVEDITISAWINQSNDIPHNDAFPNQSFVWRGDYLTANDPYILFRNQDNFVFRRDVGNGEQIEQVFTSKTAINSNNWGNVIGVFQSNLNKMSIYLDGVLKSEYIINTPIQYLTAGFKTVFGSVADYIPSYLGNLDDIAIWNRALSPEEITQLFEIQSCGTPLTVNINASGTISANPGSGIQIQAQTNLDSTRWQWQAEAAEMGWNNLSNNARYQGIDSSKLRVTGIKISNHLQKFRVVGKSGACADTSGTVVLQVTDTCITSISDTSFVTITDTSFITIYDTNTTTVYDTNLVTVTDTLIINTIITAGNPGISNTLKAWPNPTAGMLYISTGNFASMAGYAIRISSASGQQVYESQVNQALLEIPLESFGANGLYYMRLYRPNGDLVTTRKIVLQQ